MQTAQSLMVSSSSWMLLIFADAASIAYAASIADADNITDVVDAVGAHRRKADVLGSYNETVSRGEGLDWQ
jgi:hypothetical protein